MMNAGEIFLKGFFVLVMGASIIALSLFIVGETVEHFTP